MKNHKGKFATLLACTLVRICKIVSSVKKDLLELNAAKEKMVQNMQHYYCSLYRGTEPLLKPPKTARSDNYGQNFEKTVRKNTILFYMFIFPYVLAHSLLPHFSCFGPRLACFWGRGPFLDPPVLSDSACPKAARVLYTARL